MALNFPSTPADGDTYSGFIWVASENAWRKEIVTTLEQSLADVNINTPQSGQALTYDGVEWINSTPASDLPSLTDVDISSPVIGQTLVYNGTQWVNQDPAGGGIEAAFLFGG